MDIDTRQDGDFSPIARCSYSGLSMDKRRQGGEGEAAAPLFRLWRFRLLSRDILKKMLRFRRDRRNKGAHGGKKPRLDLKAKDFDDIAPFYLILALPSSESALASLHSSTGDDSSQGSISPPGSPCDSECDAQCRKRPLRASTDESSSSASSTPYSDVAQKIRRIGEDSDANSCGPRTSDGAANSACSSALDCSPRDLQTRDMDVMNEIEESGYDCAQGSTSPLGSPCDSQCDYHPQGMSKFGFASSTSTRTTPSPEEGLAELADPSCSDPLMLELDSLALTFYAPLSPPPEIDPEHQNLDSNFGCLQAMSDDVSDDVTGLGGGDAGKATASQVPALSGTRW
jgi:hypothetical protein